MRHSQSNHNGIDVLIAEDEFLTRLALRRLLEAQGYHCAEAADGTEALEIARETPPRLMLLDYMMPGMSGLSVAQQLQADPRTAKIKLYLITGEDSSATRSAARQAGCDVVITKPFDFDQILDVVSIALNPAQNVFLAQS